MAHEEPTDDDRAAGIAILRHVYAQQIGAAITAAGRLIAEAAAALGGDEFATMIKEDLSFVAGKRPKPRRRARVSAPWPCSYCGSANVTRRGFTIVAGGERFPKWYCGSCGHWMTKTRPVHRLQAEGGQCPYCQSSRMQRRGFGRGRRTRRYHCLDCHRGSSGPAEAAIEAASS